MVTISDEGTEPERAASDASRRPQPVRAVDADPADAEPLDWDTDQLAEERVPFEVLLVERAVHCRMPAHR